MKEIRNRSIEEYYKTLLFLNESTNDYFFLWNMEDQTFHFAREILTRCGYGDENLVFTRDELVERTIYEGDRSMIRNILLNAENGTQDVIDFTFRYLDSEGRKNQISCKGKVMRDARDNPYMLVGCLSRQTLLDKLDMLTGFFNFSQMQEDMAAVLAEGRSGHFLILGIDDFREINRIMGREFGDGVLKKAAECLENLRQEQHQVYRLEGDNFAVNLSGCSPREVLYFYNAFREKFSDQITVSGGCAAYPVKGDNDVHTLVCRAEDALARAKSGGKNRLYHFTEEDMDKDLSAYELKQEIWQSIQEDCRGFELYYQPQVTSIQHKLYGAEALLRYHSDKFGFLSPAKFIPVLEETGMIVDVGKWVMRTAFAQCAAWRKTDRNFHISVNLSYAQLREETILEDVLRALHEAQIPGNAVTLEITESMQLQNYTRSNSLFAQFREHGIEVSIDDFGTGYSSLNYLKSLEIDEVKIDRSFIRQIHKSAYGYRLLNNILELTNGTAIRVCCEGVEEKEELRCIDSLAPELIQGYIFSQPLPAEQFEQTKLQPDRAYRNRLESLCTESEFPGQHEEWFGSEVSYREILNSMRNAIYVLDAETGEVCYMNSVIKKLAGAYDYHGRKCYEIFWGRKKKCEGCSLAEGDLTTDEIQEMFFVRYGKRASVYERTLDWKGRTVKLVNARILNNDSDSEEKRVRQELATAEMISRMYEQAAYAESLKDCIDSVLEYIGKYYEADRAELFLADRKRDRWTACYHYLNKGVMPKERLLETATTEKMMPWLRQLERKTAIYIDDCSNPGEEFRELTEGMRIQKLRNSMMCCLRDQDGIMGILIMDNIEPEKSGTYLLKKGAELLQGKFVRLNRTEKEIPDIVERTTAREILAAAKLGLWQIKIDCKTGKRILLADDVMKDLLGVDDQMSPGECYDYWNSGVASGYNHYVNSGLDTMIATDRIIEMEYTWNHPVKGAQIARCVGARTAQTGDCILLEGYYRFNDDMKRVRSMSENSYFEHFEYHEKKHFAYFHTSRSIIYGSEKKEEGFPKSWVEKEIIHPDQAEMFAEFFTNVASRTEKQYMKVRLLNKEREYIWFRVEAYRIGRNKKDMDSMLVVMIPEK